MVAGAWLLTTVFLPLAGALLAGGSVRRARQSALVTTVFTLILAAGLLAAYPPGNDAFALYEFRWFGQDAPVDIRFSLALDGLGLWLFGLTALLSVVAVLVSWEAIDEHPAAYYRLLLILETGMLGVFAARDIILFNVFFEFTLIPLFFLIGIWGSEERRRAAIKFFLFTMAGGVLTFLGLLALVFWNYAASGRLTFSIPELAANLGGRYPVEPLWLQVLIFAALFAGFAIKVPLVPLHTWLPLAHVQAPTAGSVILAGVLLKVGTYGFVRFAVPMLPDAVAVLMPWLLGLCVAGIVYGALVALAQADMKRLIAYSSVSHLGFCMLGVFALNRLGIQGGVLQMINHGLSTGGLFAVVGMIYERYHTRQIADLGGLARRTPRLAAFFVLLTLASIGLPGLNGFAGEFLLLVGMFQRAWGDPLPQAAWQLRAISVLATLGVVLGAWYMLQLVERMFFGPLREPSHAMHPQAHRWATAAADSPSPGPGGAAAEAPPVADLSLRETMALAPLAVLILWIGLWPGFFLERMGPTLNRLSAPAVASAARQAQAPAAALQSARAAHVLPGSHPPHGL